MATAPISWPIGAKSEAEQVEQQLAEKIDGDAENKERPN